MYRWCDGGHIFGSVVHVGTFHDVMMSSICLPICQEPPSRFWKPSEITRRKFSVYTAEVYNVKLDYLQAMMDSIRGEVAIRMSTLQLFDQYAIPTRIQVPTIQSRPWTTPETVLFSMLNHSISVEISAQSYKNI